MSVRDIQPDDRLVRVDIAALIAEGVAGRSRSFFAEGAVAAAIRADAAGTLPRSLSFLAEVVRRGGLPYAAGLPEPLPDPDQARLARAWITAALQAGQSTAAALTFAQWLDAVATLVASRRAVRSTRQ